MALRIPRLSLHVERDESTPLGELRGETVGLALLTLIALDLVLGGAGSTTEPGFNILRTACGASVAVALLAGALADTRFHALFRRRGSAVAGGCLTLTGAALSIGGICTGGAARVVLEACGGVVLGAGLALLVFLWGIAFGRLDLTDVSFNAVAGVAVGILAYALVASRMPVPWGHALVGLLQGVHLALLRNRVTDALPDPDMREATYFSELQIKRYAFATKIVPTLLSLGLVLGNLILHADFALRAVSGAAGELACVAATLVGSLIMLGACIVARKRSQSFGHAFRTVVPLVALLILPLVLAQAPTINAASISLLCAFVIIATMCWAYPGSLAQGFRLSPVFVFGLGVGSMVAGYLLASPLNLAVAPNVPNVLPGASLGLVVCLFCLVVATGLFPRRDDIRAIVVRSYEPSEMWGADAEDDGPCARCARGLAEPCAGGDGGTGPGAAGRQLPRSHAGTPYACGEELPVTAAGPAGKAEASAGDTSAADADGEAMSGGGDGDEVRKGRFVRRCEYVADTFLLSRRETDVLFLLAKGRNVSFITQQLYISEGTAKTHVNHVYKKLGVHSRQELIELIDQFDA